MEKIEARYKGYLITAEFIESGDGVIASAKVTTENVGIRPQFFQTGRLGPFETLKEARDILFQGAYSKIDELLESK